jgi:hypothetical protein
VRLRGHHFICLQFFEGWGYSEEFVENLREVVGRATDRPAILVAGADDVCSSCDGLGRDGTCQDPQAGEIEVNRIDGIAWGVLGIAPGDLLSLADARERLVGDAVSAGRWRFDACDGCTWETTCEKSWGDLLGEAERAARAADPGTGPEPR